MSEALKQRLSEIEARIVGACARSGRPRDAVCLVAVSKTFDVAAIRAAHALGLDHFGESYVQEWREKDEALGDEVSWHLIGHLQSNKIKYLGDRVALIHSVDRASLLDALEKQMTRPQPILLQVNVAGEAQKSGVAPEALCDLLERATRGEQVRVMGLMTVPPYVEDAEENRSHFARLRELGAQARAWLDARGLLSAHPCDQLSMGMSGDFEVAIEEGATLVRVGSALFGERDYSA